jgi:transcriptional regulator HMO1
MAAHQLLERLGQVADSMRACANTADEFARIISTKTLVPGVNPFGDGLATAAPQTGKRKALAVDGDGKKKKEKKPKDPNAPKRPPSSYLIFQNEVRAELKAKYPELPNSELLQMISKRWAAMSDEDKEVHIILSP